MKNIFTLLFSSLLLFYSQEASTGVQKTVGFKPVKFFPEGMLVDGCEGEVFYSDKKAYLELIDNADQCGSINESKEKYLIKKIPSYLGKWGEVKEHIAIQLVEDCPCLTTER